MDDDSQTTTAAVAPKRGFDFWMVYVSNLSIDMLSVLDLMAVSTALPTIVSHLHGTDFIWAGSAYTIASTAIVPIVGDLVSSFGRKPILLTFVLTFALGSAICGGAQSMNMFIAGRAIQGFGGGGCLAVTEIVYADLIPLPDRGKFQGIIASVWAIGCAIGPPIGGAIAKSGAWRWIFFMNLPLCGIALILTSIFLRVNAPKTSWREKLKEMDWIGLIIIVGSTVSLTLGLTWGGIKYRWDSANVLVPIIVGAVGLVVFLILEKWWLKGKTIPSYFFTSRTTLSGYNGTFCHGMVSLGAIFYFPVYFQAVHNASPIRSGVDIFPITFLIPFAAMATGITFKKFDKYRPQNYAGWAITLIGFGVATLLDEKSSRAQYICSQLPLGIGIGIIWVATQFPILAPLPVSNNAHALGFFTFTRRFAQSWGIIIGGVIMQNILLKDLPASYIATLPQGVEIAYAVIPDIPNLPDALRAQVQAAFANATQLIWKVMLGVSALGLLTCLPMREEKIRESLDEQWGLKEREAEKAKVDYEANAAPTADR